MNIAYRGRGNQRPSQEIVIKSERTALEARRQRIEEEISRRGAFRGRITPPQRALSNELDKVNARIDALAWSTPRRRGVTR